MLTAADYIFPFLRAGLTLLATETTQLQDSNILITFIDLTRLSFDPEVEICFDCSITVQLRTECISDDLTSHGTSITSSIAYYPVDIQVSLYVPACNHCCYNYYNGPE